MICGLFQFDDPAAQQLVRLLPKTITVDAGASPQSEWMQSTLRMISPEAKEMSPGGETIITRLADILVIHAIRFWISHNHSAQTGWLRALHDPHYWQGHFEDSSRPWRTLDACITGPRAAGGAETTSTNILARYGKGEEPDREGTVKYASFTLLGQEFEAMDSAREGKFALRRYRSSSPTILRRKSIIFGKAFRRSEPDSAGGSRTDSESHGRSLPRF
jgi:hypothetical protein